MANGLPIFQVKSLEQTEVLLSLCRRQRLVDVYSPTDIAFVVCKIVGGTGPACPRGASRTFVVRGVHRSSGRLDS
jgi:hypothetical protein